MGVLDRLRKKEPAEIVEVIEDSPSQLSEHNEIVDEVLPGLEIDPPKKRRFGFIKLLVLFILLGTGLAAHFYYQYQDVLENAHNIASTFFGTLHENRPDTIYSFMSETYQSGVSKQEFENLIKGSIFLFDRLDLQTDFIQNAKFEQDANKALLRGKLNYSDNSVGKFTLYLAQQENPEIPFLIEGFKVESDERKTKVYELAFTTLENFFTDLKAENLEVFKDYLHTSVQTRFDNVQLEQLHRKLVDANLQSPEFDPNDFEAKKNVELSFRGFLTGQNDTRYSASITLFYDDLGWHILAIDLQPQV